MRLARPVTRRQADPDLSAAPLGQREQACLKTKAERALGRSRVSLNIQLDHRSAELSPMHDEGPALRPRAGPGPLE